MTKKEMKTIQAVEAAARLELAVYDSIHAPADGNDSRLIEWETADPGHTRLLYAWNAIYSLMEALGITADYDCTASIQALDLNTELFVRRQAAKGITYDAEGNEVCA